jgi:hypothetical protein
VKSAATRAESATLRLRQLLANFVERDTKNSSCTLYTSVSDDLRQQNGSDRQWFRNVTTADTMPTRAPDIDSNFSTLVHRRAQTIEKLDALTAVARERGSGGSAGASLVGDASGSCAPAVVQHQEHVVSDGRVYTEARQLGSMPDSKLVIDELKHTILFAFGVPPQALGQNINSERIAASNRLTEMAITTYMSFITLLRTRIGEAVRSETETERGSYIGFALCLPQYELEKLRPFMKTSVCRMMMARCYGIPENFLDVSKIREVTEAETGTGSFGGGAGAPVSAGEPRKPATKRKRDATQSADEDVNKRRDKAAKKT